MAPPLTEILYLRVTSGPLRASSHYFRRMNEDDVLKFQPGDHVYALANDGTAKRVKINSKVKTWKTVTDQRHYTIEVSLKYGLYEYDKWRNCSKFVGGFACAADDISRFLIEVDHD